MASGNTFLRAYATHADPEHVSTDHCPGFGDQRIERTAGVGRRVITPQCVDQAVSRDWQQPRNYEVGEQQATLTSREEVVHSPAQQLDGECPAELHPSRFIHVVCSLAPERALNMGVFLRGVSNAQAGSMRMGLLRRPRPK
jgi:hypothetical protein